jgi:hypothetical protein
MCSLAVGATQQIVLRTCAQCSACSTMGLGWHADTRRRCKAPSTLLDGAEDFYNGSSAVGIEA